MKVPNGEWDECFGGVSLSRLQNEGSQPYFVIKPVKGKSIKATE